MPKSRPSQWHPDPLLLGLAGGLWYELAKKHAQHSTTSWAQEGASQEPCMDFHAPTHVHRTQGGDLSTAPTCHPAGYLSELGCQQTFSFGFMSL